MKRHQSSGAPCFFSGAFLKKHAYKCWQCFNQTRKYQKHNSMFGKKVNLTYLIPIFNIYNNTEAERAPEFCCPLFSVQRVPEPDPLPGISFDTRPDPIQF